MAKSTKKDQHSARQMEIWELRQKMWTQERIAKHLGMSHSAVAQILNKMCEEYRKNNLANVEAVKHQQITQLEAIADEALQAWEKSKKDKKSKTFRSTIVKDMLGNTTQNDEANLVQTVEEQTGDARYLTVALKAKEDIRKITGADAPIKIITEGSPKDGAYKDIFENGLTVEEAKKRYHEVLNKIT